MTADPFKQSSRRQFLKGHSALDAVRDSLAAPQQEMRSTGDTAEDSSENIAALRKQASHIQHFSKQAMGCQFQFMFNATQYPLAAEVVGEAFELVETLEAEMSIYRDDSCVSRLNKAQAGERIEVSKHLFKCFEQAIEVSKLTGGAFDVTCGQLSELWGFERRSPRVPKANDVDAALRSVNFRNIELHDDRTISVAVSGPKINFGGIGKGYALDQCAILLEDAGIQDFVIHGGQSSVVARGNRTRDKSSSTCPSEAAGWTIGLSHPMNSQRRLKELHLVDQCLGTSGSARQAVFHQGKKLSHIVDPRTGWPASEVLSATVVGGSAARTDALATAFCVMGIEDTRTFCRDRPGISAVVTWLDSNAKLPKTEFIGAIGGKRRSTKRPKP